MKDIIIIGAGGFGREIKGLIDDINSKKKLYNLLGFYDDNPNLPEFIHGIPYLGSISDLEGVNKELYVALGIGQPDVKEKLASLLSNKNYHFPALIHPSALIGKDNITVGKGTIICAGSILTCDIELGDFVTLNLMTTIGHDTQIGHYVSIMPSVNISGEVSIGNKVYIGTGSKIINQTEIGKSSVIGAGAIVTKSIPENCTAVGIPAKPIKFHQ